MSAKVGKKFVLLTPDVYETLLKKSNDHKTKNLLEPTEKSEMLSAEGNMKHVWERDDLSNDEKVRIYTEELNSLNRNRNDIIKPKEKTPYKYNNYDEETTPVEEAETSKSEKATIDEIVNALPKSLRKESSQILRFIKSKPEQMTWNDEKELVYRGSALHGSNIAE